MEAKLIKQGGDYYITTHNETNLCYHLKNKELLEVAGVGEKSGEVHHNKGWNKNNEVVFIDTEHKLSLENCQAIERGYDLDELATKHHKLAYIEAYNPNIAPYVKEDYKAGFQKALEILGDKNFSEVDMRKAMGRVWDWCEDDKDEDCSSMTELRNKHIQSLQKTEWDVIVVMEVVYDGLDEMAQPQYYKQPKLDSDGCLILKRK